MAGEVRIGGTSASVRLQGNDTIASDQAFTFPDAGGEIVVTPGTANIETSGNFTAANGGGESILAANGSFSLRYPFDSPSSKIILAEAGVSPSEVFSVTGNGRGTLYRPTSTGSDSIFHVKSNVNGNDSFCFYVTANGNWYTNGSKQSLASERRLKKDIEPIDADLAWQTIKDVPYYSYRFKTEESDGDLRFGPMVDDMPSALIIDSVAPDETGVMVAQADEQGPIRTYNNGMFEAQLYTALRSALTRIEALEAEIQTLKGGAS